MKVQISIKKQKQISLSWTFVFWVLVAAVYFESTYLIRFGIINLLYTGLKLLSIIFLLIYHKKFSINKICFLIIGYECALLFSTYLAGNFSINYLISACSSILFALVLNCMVEVNPIRCIKAVYTILELMIYLNFLSIILFPEGLYNVEEARERNYYFLGHQNSVGIYIIVTIILALILLYLDDENSHLTLRVCALTLVSFVTVIKVWSVTSGLGCVGIIGLLIYDKVSSKGWRLSIVTALLINAGIFLLLVVGQTFDVLSWLIEDVFHRDMTLSGRIYIWKVAIDAFLNSPFFGVGMGQGKVLFNLTTAHNRYLNTFFTGGIVAAVLFIWQLLTVNSSVYKARKYKSARMMGIFFWVVLLMFQIETYDNNLIPLMMVLGSKIDRIQERTEIYKKTLL